MRLTIQIGTVTEYKDGFETTENIYGQNVDELMEEFEKQKSEFKNPNVTENEIMKFAEKSQDSKRVQKLGQYEDIDENPEHLADIKKALEIIKREPFAFASLTLFLKDFNTYEEWEKVNPNCFTKEEFDLVRKALL